ncbi:MAG TPA: helix-turn-helix transcriptional regulator [Chthonomonadaceae bacterium]|nr:helix-turn-helix transcriptional regulator [Chthonomonadaceae bacterium]
MRPSEMRRREAPRVYTDAPARCTRLPGGFFDFDTDCNVIVHREEIDWSLSAAQTRLSIRCAFGGQRRFEVDRRSYMVDDSAYLLLNLGQIVQSSVAARAPVECFNVTFRPGFAEEALAAVTLPDEKLLDEPLAFGQPVGFFVRTYPHNDALSRRLLQVRTALAAAPNPSRVWLDEQFHFLVGDLLSVHRRERSEIEAMPGARHATRVECYERMHTAREYMRAASARPLTLPQIAGVACMAPHHFLRTFKRSFRQTPHQFLTDVRLERARTLLRRTQAPVTDICLEVGFESLGSFSTLFSRRFGKPPSRFRADQG